MIHTLKNISVSLKRKKGEKDPTDSKERKRKKYQSLVGHTKKERTESIEQTKKYLFGKGWGAMFV